MQLIDLSDIDTEPDLNYGPITAKSPKKLSGSHTSIQIPIIMILRTILLYWRAPELQLDVTSLRTIRLIDRTEMSQYIHYVYFEYSHFELDKSFVLECDNRQTYRYDCWWRKPPIASYDLNYAISTYTHTGYIRRSSEARHSSLGQKWIIWQHSLLLLITNRPSM
jgi:hypothetical protein